MTRNRAIVAGLLLAVAALSASPAAGQDKPPVLGVGAHEITIRNVTDKAFAYTLRPYGSEDKPQPYSLAPEGMHRFPAPGVVVVGYLKYGREVSYSLYPGKAYSFRVGAGSQVDIWVGAHGKEDAVDLAPWVPTPPEVIIKMLDLAKVGKDSLVYDLGCGDGRIVVTAAKVYHARGVGIDIEPARIKESKASAKASKVEDLVKFKTSDVMKVDLSPATVVTIYLLPESNALLRPKLEKELKPGVYVVTHNYMIPGWEKKEIESAVVPDKEGVEHSVFLYRR
jgi:hypothetical protein